MDLLQAIVLGIVQGLTEFIPISSTAHLRIVPAIVGWDDPGAAFTAVIQCGTLAAVLIYFRTDITRIVRAVLADFAFNRFCHNHDARVGWMIALGSIPIVVIGLLLKDSIEGPFRRLEVIVASMIGLAVALLAAEWVSHRLELRGRTRDMDLLGWGDALAIGLAQVLALIPGASRSGVTITGGLFRGLTRPAAARFSFLLSLPSVFAAGIYELIKERHALLSSREDVLNLVAATLVAGVVGYLSIAFLLAYLKTHSTYLFIFYRFALGIFLLIWILR